MPPTLDSLRRDAVALSLFPPTTLARALDRLGFVQADPIRSPARAQDLTLRHRVKGYRAGDLERRYPSLAVEEDFFVNYGFLARPVHALLHPRPSAASWPAGQRKRADAILAFVRERGSVHPREVDAHFAHGTVTNYWGGSSNATTHLLLRMHRAGLLRVARRDAGIRVYEPAPALAPPADAAERAARQDAIVDVLIRKYAPLPRQSLTPLIARLRWGAPQWDREIRRAIERAERRLPHARVDGVDWYWPAGMRPGRRQAPDAVRLLAPFDPVVWDRRRFERLWGWDYRFEAYTPAPKRRFGYYALPILWRDQVIGWANVSSRGGALHARFGYPRGRRPTDPAYARALEAELARMRAFLGLATC